MAFVFKLELPNASEVFIRIDDKELCADLFSRLFENLAADFVVHGLDCILKEIKDIDHQIIIFNSHLPLRDLNWSSVRTALFRNGQFIGKFGGPLYFPLDGWQQDIEFLPNPPYWEILQNEDRLHSEAGVSLFEGHLQYPIEKMKKHILLRLDQFIAQFCRHGIQSKKNQISLSAPYFLSPFYDQESSTESRSEIGVFLDELCNSIVSTVDDILKIQDPDVLYQGYLLGPIKIIRVCLKWEFPNMDTFMAMNSFKPTNLFHILRVPNRIWIRLNLNKIVEITEIDPEGRYHPSIKWVQLEAPRSYFLKSEAGWEFVNEKLQCPNFNLLKKEIKKCLLSDGLFFMSEDIPLNFELLPSELTQKIRYLLNILYLVSSVKPSVECSNWLNFFHEIDLAESVEELQLHYFKYLSLNIEKNN